MKREKTAPIVLAVDDEPAVLELLKRVLSVDFHFLATTRADEALRILQEEEVAVIIADQRMPDLSGDKLLQISREVSSATRVLLTGFPDVEALARAVNEGQIYGYVTKPWKPEFLSPLIHRAAEHYALRRELDHERYLLHLLMEHIPDAIAFKDGEGRFTRVNRAQAELLGLEDPGQAEGHREVELVGEGQAAAEEPLLGGDGPLVDRIEKCDDEGGRSRWYSVSRVPIDGPERRRVGLVSIARDITRRRVQELQEKIVHQVRAEVWRMNGPQDIGLVLMRVRDGLRELGVPFDACTINVVKSARTGTSVRFYGMGEKPDCWESDDPALTNALLRIWRKGEMVYRQDLEAEDPFGEYERFRQAYGHTVRSALDMPFSQGTLAVNSARPNAFSLEDRGVLENLASVLSEGFQRLGDLEALATKEQQLVQAQKMEAIGQLAAGVAHDFNNLSVVIQGNIEYLLRKMHIDEGDRQILQEVLQVGEQTGTIVNQLMAFSRRQMLQPEILDLRGVVENLEKVLRRLLDEDIDLAMSMAAEPLRVKVDRGQLEQILINLVVNARDAMPGGGLLLVETESVQVREGDELGLLEGAYTLLRVSDTGEGMDADTQARIFEPFFTTKAQKGGTGLGLAVTYGIVTQSGGAIRVDSAPGEGACFEILLPQTKEEVDEKIKVEETLRGTETVLVVEDDDVVRRVLVRMLRGQGYTVLAASSGEAAMRLSAQQKESIHLLVSDLVMQGMNGICLADCLVAARPGLKVLLVSGHITRQLSEGGYHFLHKPFSYNSLLGKVRDLLDDR